MEILSLNDFLMWLISGAGSVMCASWLLERWSWYQNIQNPRVKEDVFFGISSSIGISAYLLVTYASEFLAQAQPFFMVLLSVFGLVYIGKAWHREMKTKKLDG